MLDIFQGFERTVFPEAECTIPNAREPEVKDSDSVYLCVVVDDRFDTCELKFLRPYIFVDSKEGTLYGWTQYRDNIVDHCTRPIHEDHERVVAWKKLPSGAPDDFREVFNVAHCNRPRLGDMLNATHKK